MGSKPQSLGKDAHALSPYTPGPSGQNDTGSPHTPDWFVGGTPGSTGINDWADPNLNPDLGLPFRPKTFHELDVNPARGLMQRTQFLAEHNLAAKSEKESPATLFDKFLSALDRIDKGLTGDAKQSWGVVLGGTAGSSAGSTAAKPTKDVRYLNSGIGDLKELFEIFDLLLLTMADKIPGDVKGSLEAKKEEIFTTWKKAREEPAKLVLEKVNDVKEIKEAREDEPKREARLKQTVAQLLGQFKALRKEMEKIDFKGADTAAKPKAFTIPGKLDYWKLKNTYYKMTWYYMKDKSGKKGLFVLKQTSDPTVFEIQTDGNQLYPLSSWDKSAEDGPPPRRNGESTCVTRYPAGCHYLYKGAESLFQDLPVHP